jgi:hypothetical protein
MVAGAIYAAQETSDKCAFGHARTLPDSDFDTGRKTGTGCLDQALDFCTSDLHISIPTYFYIYAVHLDR